MLRITGAGPERAPEITIDPHIALSIRWHPAPAEPCLWWRFYVPGAMLEAGFHTRTNEIADLTLVMPGPITRAGQGLPAAPETAPGLPRCDPAEWARRASGGVVESYADHHVDEAEPVRTEVGPDHLLVRIGAGDEPAAREMVCGRVRFGLAAGDLLLWVAATGFSPEERALLDGHAAWSTDPARPRFFPAPAPARRGWRAWLPGGR